MYINYIAYYICSPRQFPFAQQGPGKSKALDIYAPNQCKAKQLSSPVSPIMNHYNFHKISRRYEIRKLNKRWANSLLIQSVHVS